MIKDFQNINMALWLAASEDDYKTDDYFNEITVNQDCIKLLKQITGEDLSDFLTFTLLTIDARRSDVFNRQALKITIDKDFFKNSRQGNEFNFNLLKLFTNRHKENYIADSYSEEIDVTTGNYILIIMYFEKF